MKKRLVILILFFLIVISLENFIGAQNCPSGDRFLKLSASTNAHAAKDTDPVVYSTALCYRDYFTVSGSIQGGGTTLLKLSANSNAHAEGPTQSNYLQAITFGDLKCELKTAFGSNTCQSVSGVSNPGSRILFLSAQTNAHLAIGSSSYQYELCCASTGTGANYNPPICNYNGACAGNEDAQNCEDCDGGGEICGNGVCRAGETNANCPSDCPAVCGDGVREGSEQCDAGANNGACPDHICSLSCTNNNCGGDGECTTSDGGRNEFVGAYLQTDSGPAQPERCIDSDTVQEIDCTLPVQEIDCPFGPGCVGSTSGDFNDLAYCSLCGNGVCDNDGLNRPFSAYNENAGNCADCGQCNHNNNQEGTEECDDGNLVEGDGCSNTCQKPNSCNTVCTLISGCGGSFSCDSSSLKCRNTACSTETDCTCSVAEVCSLSETWTHGAPPVSVEVCRDYSEVIEGNNRNDEVCVADCAVVAQSEADATGFINGRCEWDADQTECYFVGTSLTGDYCRIEYSSGSETCGEGQSTRQVTYKKLNEDGVVDPDNCPWDTSCGNTNPLDTENYGSCTTEIPCGRVVQLPFFGTAGAIGAVILIVLIYFLLVKNKKLKKRLHKKNKNI